MDMKVDAIGINSYQQLSGQETNRQKAAEDSQELAQAQKTITIPVQEQSESSRLAVKAPSGSYADYLSPEERNALDLLFSRYSNRAAFNRDYSPKTNNSGNDSHLGNNIDLKV